MLALQGKIAVVTGGSSGIGLATAKRFVKEGAYVFITGRRQAELDKAVAEIGSHVTAVQGDVSNLDDLDRLYKEVASKKGKLDVLFANAGIVEPTPTATVSPRANVISPGPVETPILKGQFGENTDAMKERFKTMVPMGRIGKPEEIASAAVFLASDESSYITGIDLPVDGGLVAVQSNSSTAEPNPTLRASRMPNGGTSSQGFP